MIRQEFACHTDAENIKFTGICVIINTKEEIWMKDGLWHRLDGPALFSKKFSGKYWINDKPVSVKDFYNHPLVLKHKLNSILALDD